MIMKERVWEKIPPWNGLLSPFSILGRFLGNVGSATAAFHWSITNLFHDSILSAEYAVWLGIFLSFVILTMVILYSNRKMKPMEKNEQGKNATIKASIIIIVVVVVVVVVVVAAAADGL